MPAVTLFVRRLPAAATNEHLAEVFSEIGPLKNCFVVGDRETEKCRGFGYVTFSMEEDAQRAIKEVKVYEGEKIFVTVAKKKPDNKKKKKKVKTEEDSEDTKKPQEPTETKSPAKCTNIKKNKLKARLIIRNLSFKCEEADLTQIFSKFGTVIEAKIPLKPDGKKRGFAFVQFKNMAEAGKALAAMNLKEIKDRQVAVDWAIAKDKYLATQSAGAAGTVKEENVNSNSKGAGADGNEKEAKKKPTSQEEKDDSESEEEEASEDEDDDEANSSEEEDAENDSESQQTDSDASEPDDYDDDDDDDDTEGKTPPKKKRDPLPTDVNEGRTIFIRNLAFDTDEEGLEEVLLQFGELKYVRVVMNADTGCSKGCAFAQFKSKEAAEKCIAAAAQDEKEFGGIKVDGRRLNILPAVNREDAAKFKDKKVKTHTGSRNLYLAREGLIRPGSNAAEEVSEADMAKRTRFEELKRAKLKDISIYVSKTRLCVHNLPKSVDQQKLQKLCLSAAGGKGVRITECRVMYDKKPIRGQVIGKSLGYGFVEFKEHEHALQALRHLNNNPDIFGPQKRPIVEFSLEDGRKLKLKAIRLENSKKQLKKVSSQKGEQPQQQQHSGKKKGPLRKENAANVVKQKDQGSQYSGFMSKPEVEHVELKDGKKRPKVLHMPSHRGPKIRKRDKGKQPMVQPKKQNKGPSRKERMISTFTEKSSMNRKPNGKPAKRKFQNRDDVRFDTLVNQYKKKLMGTSNTKTAVKKSKWFI
ncbi:RNA-binding protein 28 isoform X2 [Sinocyclocheilus grahami]|uniref:RNA-binding protein 28 isoform X2 n=1 Tax=Sinocyclocheilus grahami TaxID=75366 RepID=UPI0007ACE4F9|nr:PREDICTED: RNA-binding protein 28 isoform X2 [Sinocyclocheilus grahami]